MMMMMAPFNGNDRRSHNKRNAKRAKHTPGREHDKLVKYHIRQVEVGFIAATVSLLSARIKQQNVMERFPLDRTPSCSACLFIEFCLFALSSGRELSGLLIDMCRSDRLIHRVSVMSSSLSNFASAKHQHRVRCCNIWIRRWCRMCR